MAQLAQQQQQQQQDQEQVLGVGAVGAEKVAAAAAAAAAATVAAVSEACAAQAFFKPGEILDELDISMPKGVTKTAFPTRVPASSTLLHAAQLMTVGAR